MTSIHQPARQPLIDYRTLREEVSVLDVLRLLKWQLVSRSGEQLRGPCPVHGSSSPKSRSLSVNPEKNAFHCFACGAGGNQLDLAKEVFKLPLYEAARELCHRLGIEVPIANMQRKEP